MNSSISTPLPCGEFRKVDVLLASNSPRRRELLGMILPRFDIAESRDVDESFPADMPAAEVPEFLSRQKAKAYSDLLRPGEMLVTADTVVILDDRILGKPASPRQALEMLRSLCGRTHTVVTGVTLTTVEKTESFSEHTRVTFAPMDDDRLREYIELYRPFDKAGAYGIQEWFGAAAISGIEGCYYNVMGLPLHALYTHLRGFFD